MRNLLVELRVEINRLSRFRLDTNGKRTKKHTLTAGTYVRAYSRKCFGWRIFTIKGRPQNKDFLDKRKLLAFRTADKYFSESYVTDFMNGAVFRANTKVIKFMEKLERYEKRGWITAADINSLFGHKPDLMLLKTEYIFQDIEPECYWID